MRRCSSYRLLTTPTLSWSRTARLYPMRSEANFPLIVALSSEQCVGVRVCKQRYAPLSAEANLDIRYRLFCWVTGVQGPLWEESLFCGVVITPFGT